MQLQSATLTTCAPPLPPLAPPSLSPPPLPYHRQMAHAIADNKSLTLLDIGGNNIGPQVRARAPAHARAFGTFPHKAHKPAGKPALHDATFRTGYALEACPRNSAQTRSRCALCPAVHPPPAAAVQGVGALAAALRNHGSLSSLELGYNPLGPDGTKTVVDLAKFGLPKVGGVGVGDACGATDGGSKGSCCWW